MSRKEDIFKSVLTSAYDHSGFVDFSKEIITGLNVGPYTMEMKPYNTFSAFISKYYVIGDFKDPEDNKVGVFSVELLRGESVERARTAQRSFVKTLLENGGLSSALVAFYAPDNDKWRFSFVRMDYEFAKGKIKESLTPARRYSYLVGKGEPCHTAMDRLLPIFMDDSKLPTIDDIEDAFSVEKVTKDFFEAYKEKYLQMAEFLEQNEDFVIESKHRGFTTEQFTKKLLSQIVFLYFIQKKGWLGVNAVPRILTEKEYKNAFFSHGRKSRELVGKVYYKDEDVYRLNGKALQALSDEDETEFSKCVKGQPWGTGPKDFMRRIFENAVKRGQNFFDDCLEPLFYTGLNKDRGENAFFPPLHCRIPFLNGGLFEELDHYDWENNNFDIPNELFSNKDTKGRAADGILDIFDRYNFTMAEDEPLEKEVAVDPEMLGKVFENLLEVKDRKSKGAFYTPREIVHYMCSESLINYLVTKSGIPEDDIRKFITLGEFFKDEDARRTKYDATSRKYMFDYEKQLEMPASILDFKNSIDRLGELDQLLASVRVVDPAVGSGAFPLGLLNEIVKARDTLTTYMAISMNGFQRKMLYAQRSPYQLKTQTIKNCIFACDIEPSATDIAKLRLWLALVIEDEIGDQDKDEFGEHTKPRKLPNLDCNVLCGNSLVDTFEGIKLICNTEALGNAEKGTAVTITEQLIKGHIDSLIELQDKLYSASSTEEKEEIKKQIQILYDAIIMEQLQVNPNIMRDYGDPEVRYAASKPFILWPLYFPKVFKENGGFDICIGNPPYIQLQKTIDEKTGAKLGDLYADIGFKTFLKAADIYCLFYEKGIGLLRDCGTLAYITSNKWMRAGYGKPLRKLLCDNTAILQLIDYAGNKIFDTAQVDVNTIILIKEKSSSHETLSCVAGEDYKDNPAFYLSEHGIASIFNSDDIWNISTPEEITIKSILDYKGIPLSNWDIQIYRGILTGFNEAFIVDNKTKKQLVSEDPSLKNIIKPLVRGRDIKRFECNYNDLWLINVHNGLKEKGIPPVDINDYPQLKQYLDQYYDKLAKRADKGITPYNLRNCAYLDKLETTKIIYPETTQGAYFYVDSGKYYPDKTCFVMMSDHPYYLAAVLSSELFEYAYKNIYASVALGENGYQYNKHALLKLPVIPRQRIDSEVIEQLEEYAIMACSGDIDPQEAYKEISKIVYHLYNIPDNCINYIKSCCK